MRSVGRPVQEAGFKIQTPPMRNLVRPLKMYFDEAAQNVMRSVGLFIRSGSKFERSNVMRS